MRMIAKDICVKRPLKEHALYKMSSHKSSKRNPNRRKLLFSSIERMNADGLSNLAALDVRIVDVKLYNLFTHLKVHVGEPNEKEKKIK